MKFKTAAVSMILVVAVLSSGLWANDPTPPQRKKGLLSFLKKKKKKKKIEQGSADGQTKDAVVDPLLTTVPLGSIESFTHISTADGVSREVLYYVPKSAQAKLDAGERLKTLMFLHGGGGSTTTQAGATSVARMYMGDFLSYAESRKIALVFPTFTWGWDEHFSWMLPTFIDHLVAHYPFDRENIVLSGHSMGGMGITRILFGACDFFSGALAMAAGTDPFLLKEDYLFPYLSGIPYTHINGDQDHFEEFKPRMLEFKKSLGAVEKKYGVESNFQLIFHPGGHEMVMSRVKDELDKLFQKPRNIFPKVSQGYLGYGRRGQSGRRPPISEFMGERYFIKVKDYRESRVGPETGMHFRTFVEGQRLKINTWSNTMKASALELTLSSTMMDLDRAIEIMVDGNVVFSGAVSKDGATGTAKLTVPVAHQ